MNITLSQTPESEAPDFALGDECRIFAFEADFAHDLRCIPMVVRFKLDRCGIKLSLKQWSRFGRERRATLLVQRCDTPIEVRTYQRQLIELVESCGGPVVWLDIDPAPGWMHERQVPMQVIEQAALAGHAAPTVDQWRKLSTIERFALVKLARSNHDNDNFIPAMSEFGLAL